MIAPPAAPLAAWIRPELVNADLPAADADEILGGLAALLAAASTPHAPIDFHDVLDRLRAREKLSSTGVGDGCAIPHVRLPRLASSVVAVARTGREIDFGAPDGKPVRLFFGLAVPAGAATAHLQILAVIARWLRRPENREALLTAPDRDAMLHILVSA